jgi:hypothetical protein
MTRKEYFAHNAVSRSLLVALKDHPKYAKNMMEYGNNEESEALLIGDAFDTLMFDGQEVFDEKFHIMTLNNPFTDGRTLMGKFMNKCIEMLSIDEISSDIYGAAYEEVKTKTSTEDVLREEFKLGGGQYYLEELRISKEKPTLTQEQYLQIVAMKEQLLDNQFVKHWFIDSLTKGQDTYEKDGKTLIYQKVILWEQEGVECKVMLDIIEIDHDRKTIIPVDLKTTSNKGHYFDGSILKYDYAYQGGFYTLGLENWRDINYEGYAILPFRFVFVEKSCTFAPMIYVLSNKDNNITIYGGEYNGKPVRSILGLLHDYKWHMETGLWEYRKQVYDDNGMEISDLFDYVDVWDMLKTQ